MMQTRQTVPPAQQPLQGASHSQTLSGGCFHCTWAWQNGELTCDQPLKGLMLGTCSSGCAASENGFTKRLSRTGRLCMSGSVTMCCQHMPMESRLSILSHLHVCCCHRLKFSDLSTLAKLAPDDMALQQLSTLPDQFDAWAAKVQVSRAAHGHGHVWTQPAFRRAAPLLGMVCYDGFTLQLASALLPCELLTRLATARAQGGLL